MRAIAGQSWNFSAPNLAQPSVELAAFQALEPPAWIDPILLQVFDGFACVYHLPGLAQGEGDAVLWQPHRSKVLQGMAVPLYARSYSTYSKFGIRRGCRAYLRNLAKAGRVYA